MFEVPSFTWSYYHLEKCVSARTGGADPDLTELLKRLRKRGVDHATTLGFLHDAFLYGHATQHKEDLATGRRSAVEDGTPEALALLKQTAAGKSVPYLTLKKTDPSAAKEMQRQARERLALVKAWQADQKRWPLDKVKPKLRKVRRAVRELDGLLDELERSETLSYVAGVYFLDDRGKGLRDQLHSWDGYLAEGLARRKDSSEVLMRRASLRNMHAGLFASGSRGVWPLVRLLIVVATGRDYEDGKLRLEYQKHATVP